MSSRISCLPRTDAQLQSETCFSEEGASPRMLPFSLSPGLPLFIGGKTGLLGQSFAWHCWPLLPGSLELGGKGGFRETRELSLTIEAGNPPHDVQHWV